MRLLKNRLVPNLFCGQLGTYFVIVLGASPRMDLFYYAENTLRNR